MMKMLCVVSILWLSDLGWLGERIDMGRVSFIMFLAICSGCGVQIQRWEELLAQC